MSAVETKTVTEVDVLRESLAWLSKPGRFTGESFFESKDRFTEFSPGSDIGATCAIGGVEQALWRLTGDAISGYERSRRRQKFAQFPWDIPRQDGIYADVMHRLNRKAQEMFGAPTVEHVASFCQLAENHRRDRRRTLDVFEAALADAEAGIPVAPYDPFYYRNDKSEAYGDWKVDEEQQS